MDNDDGVVCVLQTARQSSSLQYRLVVRVGLAVHHEMEQLPKINSSEPYFGPSVHKRIPFERDWLFEGQCSSRGGEVAGSQSELVRMQV